MKTDKPTPTAKILWVEWQCPHCKDYFSTIVRADKGGIYNCPYPHCGKKVDMLGVQVQVPKTDKGGH